MRDRFTYLAVFLSFVPVSRGQGSGNGAASSARTTVSKTPAASLRFEVASVKPVPNGRGGGRRARLPAASDTGSNITLAGLIIHAYHVGFDGVTGGPDRVRRDYYDVQAKAERPSSGDELRAMLRNLLADRFKLQVRHGAKELQVYKLVTDETGPKLKPSALVAPPSRRLRNRTDESARETNGWRAVSRWPPSRGGSPRLRTVPSSMRPAYRKDTISPLSLWRIWIPESSERRAANGKPINPHPGMSEALQQQLGLRLEPGRGAVDFIVIDRVERPSAN